MKFGNAAVPVINYTDSMIRITTPVFRGLATIAVTLSGVEGSAKWPSIGAFPAPGFRSFSPLGPLLWLRL